MRGRPLEGAPPTLDSTAAAGCTYLALIGTAPAYALWFRGIAALPVARVAVLGLLSPVVVAAAGWLVLGQSLTPLQLTGATTIIAAVVLAQLHGRTLSPPLPDAPAPGRTRHLT